MWLKDYIMFIKPRLLNLCISFTIYLNSFFFEDICLIRKGRLLTIDRKKRSSDRIILSLFSYLWKIIIISNNKSWTKYTKKKWKIWDEEIEEKGSPRNKRVDDGIIETCFYNYGNNIVQLKDDTLSITIIMRWEITVLCPLISCQLIKSN